MRLKPNEVCWCQKMDVFYLIVKEAKRKKEKKERHRERSVWGDGGDRERVTGVRWKHITLPRVPTTSCCSPPNGLLGGDGPLSPWPCRHMPKSIESHGLIHALGRWERPRASLAGDQFDTVLCNTEDLLHHLWCRVWGPLWGPLMGHDSPSVRS